MITLFILWLILGMIMSLLAAYAEILGSGAESSLKDMLNVTAMVASKLPFCSMVWIVP